MGHDAQPECVPERVSQMMSNPKISDEFVWIFNGSKGKFPGGIFRSLEIAEVWIRSNRLTGVLTRYPLDWGSYD